MIILGSGGHTTEILRLTKPVIESKGRMLRLIFVVADTDVTSVPRVASILGSDVEFALCTVPRIRNVGESLVHAFLKIPKTFVSSVTVLLAENPDVIITNGPGTCLPIVFASLVLEFLFLSKRTVRVFVESFCRVTTISQTGRLLYTFVDSFILQWKPSTSIASKYPKAKYIGVLI